MDYSIRETTTAETSGDLHAFGTQIIHICNCPNNTSGSGTWGVQIITKTKGFYVSGFVLFWSDDLRLFVLVEMRLPTSVYFTM